MGKLQYRIGTEWNPLCWIIGEPKIGERVWIGPFCVIDASNGLTIGDDTVVACGTHLYSHAPKLPLTPNHDRHDVTGKATTIGSHVYLGPNVVVCAGVTIGDGAVIGAGTYIDEDVPEGMKVIPVQRKEYEYVGK